MTQIEWYYSIEDTTYEYSETHSDLTVYVGKVESSDGFVAKSKEYGTAEDARDWCVRILQNNAAK